MGILESLFDRSMIRWIDKCSSMLPILIQLKVYDQKENTRVVYVQENKKIINFFLSYQGKASRDVQDYPYF